MKDKTELVFILDKSGSMAGLESDTIGGYNGMLKKQKKVPGTCIVTTVLFDDGYELLHDRIDIQAIHPLTEKDYEAGGCTALYDTIGRTIHKIASVQKHTDEKHRADHVLFVIITDGMENASREYSGARIRKMIGQEQEKYGWEFVFLGANMDAIQSAENLGIRADHASDYVPDRAGTTLNFAVMSDTVAQYRQTGKFEAAMLDEIRSDEKKRGRRGRKR